MSRTRPVLEPLEDRLAPAALPAGFTETPVAAGLTRPTTLELSPDGKLFVAEQDGTLPVFAGGTLLQPDFFRDTPLGVDDVGERGLLGIAFDPEYAANRFVYVYYTATAPQVHNRVSRFTANAGGDLALPGSETVVLDLDNLTFFTNHNGGAIHFGPDGKLYVASGENNTPANAQTLDNLLGKILRLNKDGSIPADNPFFNQAAGQNRAIWALGLRNPFTFAFQPGTGRVFINDVGGNRFEEINDGRAGVNYGWPLTEGPTDDPRFQAPLFAYGRDEGCAIAGGAFYNPAHPQFPASFSGDYFFADFCAGEVRRLDPDTGSVVPFATDIPSPVDLRVADDGTLYYLSRGSGQVFQVRFAGMRAAPSTPAVFDPASGTWFLRNGTSAGPPDAGSFAYGLPGWSGVVGDWDGDGIDTVGVGDDAGNWYLRNANSAGAPDVGPFAYGLPGWVPVAGDWDGQGPDGIGVFDPATATWYLRNGPASGAPDFTPFAFGAPGWVPVVGDWDGDGTDTVGVYDPSTGTWYLRNSNSPGAPDRVFAYGGFGWQAVTGDWDGDGVTTVGVVDPSGVWHLRNANAPGAPDIPVFAYGLGDWKPFAGAYAELRIADFGMRAGSRDADTIADLGREDEWPEPFRDPQSAIRDGFTGIA